MFNDRPVENTKKIRSATLIFGPNFDKSRIYLARTILDNFHCKNIIERKCLNKPQLQNKIQPFQRHQMSIPDTRNCTVNLKRNKNALFLFPYNNECRTS